MPAFRVCEIAWLQSSTTERITKMQFVDRALARRLESAEEMPQVHHAEWCQKNQPKVGAAVEKISGGHMIFAGLGSPIGRAVGMGFAAPVTAAEMDQLEHFYY